MSAPISSPWHLVLQDIQWCPCPQAVPWPEMWWEIDANTSRVFCLASLISSHWHQQIFHFPGYICLRKVAQTQQPASFLPLGRYGLLSYIRIIYRVSQKKHSYKFFGLEIMLFTCSQTLWSGLRSSFTKWGTAPAFTTACKTTMSASRWRAWSLVQKFYKSVFSGTPCSWFLQCDWNTSRIK